MWIVLWIKGPFATAPPAEEGLGAAVRPCFHERAQLDHHGKSAGSARSNSGMDLRCLVPQSGQIGRDAHASPRVLVARAARLACVPNREAIDLDQAF